MTPKRRWSSLTDCSAAEVAHRLLSSAMRSNGDNDWPLHSLMVFLRDLRGSLLRRLFPVIFIFGSEMTEDMAGP